MVARRPAHIVVVDAGAFLVSAKYPLEYRMEASITAKPNNECNVDGCSSMGL